MTAELTGIRIPTPDAAPTSDPFDNDDPDRALGWSSAALAVRSLLQLSTPMFLRLQLAGHTPILVDFRHRAFVWGTALADFPERPGHVTLDTEPASDDAPLLFELPGQNLDGLLWKIGLAAFDGTPASWLRPDDRYRLTRWPNITDLGISVDQVRMTALLGSRFFSPWELAAASGSDVADAQRLVNAFTLMGIAYSSCEAPAPLVQRPPERTGLLARLRARMGF